MVVRVLWLAFAGSTPLERRPSGSESDRFNGGRRESPAPALIDDQDAAVQSLLYFYFGSGIAGSGAIWQYLQGEAVKWKL